MKKFSLIIQALIVSLFISSCATDDYERINTTPYNPTQVSPELTLPAAQDYSVRGMYLSVGNRYTNTFGNIMMANWSQADGYNWYVTEFDYVVTQNFYDNIWDYTYLNILKAYQDVVNVSSESEIYDNYAAIAEIMKAYHFQMLVDGYGDIPYSEALQRGSNPSPAYDDAQAIYDDLIVKLDAAIEMIKNTDAEDLVPTTGDVILGGDMTSWIQFANTLKLRILVRQSEVPGKAAYITDNIANIMAEGSGFLTVDVMANPGYSNSAGKQNPFYGDLGFNVAGDPVNNHLATCASDFVIQHLEDTNDPRIDRLYEEPATGHLGIQQGIENYPDDTTAEFVSNVGPGLLISSEQSSPIFLAAESYLLQAEAVQRGFMAGNAQSLYELGIEASFEFLGAAGASTYYAQPINNVSWTASPDKIEAIITQKWVALNGTNGWESWVEYNRTGFPQNVPVPVNQPNTDRPVRLAYPDSEYTSNATNLPDQPNVFTEKIFWGN